MHARLSIETLIEEHLEIFPIRRVLAAVSGNRCLLIREGLLYFDSTVPLDRGRILCVKMLQ